MLQNKRRRQQPQRRRSLQPGEDQRGHHEQQDARRRLREAEQDRRRGRSRGGRQHRLDEQHPAQDPAAETDDQPVTDDAVRDPVASAAQHDADRGDDAERPHQREQRREDCFVRRRVRRSQVGDQITDPDKADEDQEPPFEPLRPGDDDHRDDQLHHRDDVQDVPETRAEHGRERTEGDSERGEAPARSGPQGCHACGTFQHGAWRRDDKE